MATIIPVTQKDMSFMSLLEEGISNMRSKNNPRFDIAIDKHKQWKKDILKDIVSKKVVN